MALCEICESKTSGSLEFCKKCFKEFNPAIKERQPWVRVMKNDAQRNRRRRVRDFNMGVQSLDALLERHENGYKDKLI